MNKNIRAAITLLIISINLLTFTEITSASGLDDLFKVGSTLEVKLDENITPDDLVIYPGSSKEFNLTVEYKLNLGTLFSNFLLNTRIGKIILFDDHKFDSKMKISIQTEDSSSWCYPKLKNRDIYVDISNKFCQEKATLVVSADQYLDPYDTAKINIRADTVENDWKIKHAYSEMDLDVISGCSFNINIWSSGSNLITEGEERKAKIDIYNQETIDLFTDVEIENQPEYWDISLDSEKTQKIPAQEKVTYYVKIKTKNIPHSQDLTEIVKVKITPKATTNLDIDEKHLLGESQYVTIKLVNEGHGGSDINSQQNNPSGFGAIHLIFIFFIAITVVLILVRKKRKI